MRFIDAAVSAGVAATAQDSTGACAGDLDNSAHNMWIAITPRALCLRLLPVCIADAKGLTAHGLADREDDA